MTTRIILVACLAGLLGGSTGDTARADGMYVAPWGYEIYEPAQLAFIRYDAGARTEELSIMPKFHGDPTDFAWVVPIPALPEVSEADPQLFGDLADLSRPAYRSRDSFWSCEEEYDTADLVAPGGRDGVEIIDEDVVGIYRTMTLGADDATALLDSLTVWGFLHEGNRDEVEPMIQSYVDRDYYFVTMEVDSASVANWYWGYGKDRPRPAGKTVAPYYYYPSLQPITFSFASDDIVYPLRISAVSAYENSSVILYVAADHRMTFASAETRYANRLTPGELSALRDAYSAAGHQLRAGDFLTKLQRRYTPREMDADIVLRRAEDDAEYLAVHYSGWPFWPLVFATVTAAWVVVRRRVTRVTRAS
ncbi:MAG: DUF2330 domain-containing protein [bacterium]